MTEPGQVDVEGFASLDAGEFDGAEFVVVFFVLADDTGFAAEGAIRGEFGAAFDEFDVGRIAGGSSGEVAAFLDEGFFGVEHGGELFSEPGARVDGVEFDVAEGIARDGFAAGFHLGDNGLDAGAFGDEEVDAVVVVHDGLEAGGLLFDVDFHFGEEDRMDFLASPGEADAGEEGGFVEEFAVFDGGGGGEPAAVASHDLMDDEHAGVGVVFGDDVGEEFGALFGGGPGAEGLADGDDIIVDGFGEADDGEFVVVLGEEGGEVGGGGVGVVAADGVEDVDAVAGELGGGDLEGVLALLDEAAFDAVLDVCKFDTAVSDGASAVFVEDGDVLAEGGSDRDGVSLEESLVAADVGNEFDFGGDLGVAFDEGGEGGGKAGGQTAGGEESDFFDVGHEGVPMGGLRWKEVDGVSDGREEGK